MQCDLKDADKLFLKMTMMMMINQSRIAKGSQKQKTQRKENAAVQPPPSPNRWQRLFSNRTRLRM